VLVTSSFRAFVKETVLRRLSPRVSRQFKCELIAGGEVFQGVTEDLSYKGLSARIKADKVLPKEVMVQLYYKSLILRAEGEIVRFSKIKGKEMIYGIRFAEKQVPELSIFLSDKLK
jgi:hypothetical protein